MSKVYKVGVVGVGNMGKNHLRVLKQLEKEYKDVLVTAIHDVREEVVNKYSNMYGCKGYTNFTGFLEEDLDGVVVSVPTHLHKKVSIPLIERGFNLLVEKPLASNKLDAKEIYEKARENNVKILVGHIERFNPAVIKMKELIKDGDIGMILTISARRVGPGGLSSNFKKMVGVTMDLAIHDLDIFRYVLDREIDKIKIFSGSMTEPFKYEDFSFSIAFLGKVLGLAEANWLSPYKLRKLYVTGTEGVYELDYISQTLMRSREMGEEPRKVYIDKVEPLYNELKHFLNVLRGLEEPLIDAKDAYTLISLIEENKANVIKNNLDLG